MRVRQMLLGLAIVAGLCGCDSGSRLLKASIASIERSIGQPEEIPAAPMAAEASRPDLSKLSEADAVLNTPPEDIDWQRMQREEDVKKLNNSGVANLKAGRIYDALRDFDLAIRIDPYTAYVYVNRASAHADLGDFRQAISDCNRAIKIDPRFSQAYGLRSVACLFVGFEEQSKKDYQAAMKLDPATKDRWQKTMEKYRTRSEALTLDSK